MTPLTEPEATQLEALANMMLRLIADWREQRRKNETAQEAIRYSGHAINTPEVKTGP